MSDQKKTNQAPSATDPVRDGPVHGTDEGSEPQPTEKPSQAEGDRETVEQDLKTKSEDR